MSPGDDNGWSAAYAVGTPMFMSPEDEAFGRATGPSPYVRKLLKKKMEDEELNQEISQRLRMKDGGVFADGHMQEHLNADFLLQFQQEHADMIGDLKDGAYDDPSLL